MPGSIPGNEIDTRKFTIETLRVRPIYAVVIPP